MTDLAYEKEGSYLQAAREMLRDNIPLEKVIKYQNLTEDQVKAL